MSEAVPTSVDDDILTRSQKDERQGDPQHGSQTNPVEWSAADRASTEMASDADYPGLADSHPLATGITAHFQTPQDPPANLRAQSSKSLAALVRNVESRRAALKEQGPLAPAQSGQERRAAERALEPLVQEQATPAAVDQPINPPSSEPISREWASAVKLPVEPEAGLAAKTSVPVAMPAPPTVSEEKTQIASEVRTGARVTQDHALDQAGSQHNKWLPLGLVGGALLLAAAGGYFWFHQSSSDASSPAKTAVVAQRTAGVAQVDAPSESPLQLRVESREKAVIGIRWNRAAAPIINAKAGRLVILERDQPARTVDLPLPQLRIGHLYYQTPVDRVEFRLEVTDAKGKMTQESLLALAPSAAESSVQNAAGGAAIPIPTPGLQTGLPLSSQPGLQVDSNGTPVAGEKVPARAFQAPVRATPAERAVYLEPPAENLNAPALPLALGASANEGLIQQRVAPPPAPVNTAPAQVAAAVQSVSLIKKVAPVYPALALQNHTQGAVRLMATVTKDGTVSGVRAVSGNPLLIPAAMAAVKQWIYRPQTVNGQPQEVVTEVEVGFTLKQ